MQSENIPVGYCQDGCGMQTAIAPKTSTRRGWIKGEHLRFVHGHKLPKRPRKQIVSASQRWVVDEVSGCHFWQGSICNGYGIISVNGQRHQAHVWFFEQSHGAVPADLQLDHLCHTQDMQCVGGTSCIHRSCVNPAHLEPVTLAENFRRARGHPHMRGYQLTLAQAREILAIGRTRSGVDLAKEYGVTKQQICHILKRRSWKQADQPL